MEQDYINWWEETYENGLEEVKSEFINLFSNADFLPSIYHPILYDFLRNPQMKHWNKEIFSFSRRKIKELENQIGKDIMLSTLLSNMHFLVYAYQNLLDMEEKIILMDRFRGSEELKAKLFSINIYHDLLNTAFSNTLKFFIEFHSVIEDKKLFQKNLTPQIQCLTKRGYEKVVSLADSNIRNAISHGGVRVNGSKIFFSYIQEGKNISKESTVYEFKDSLLQLYDGVSAIVLSWIGYFCEENISYNEIYENKEVLNDTTLFFERLCMSTLLISCDRVSETNTNIQKTRSKQINIEFSGVDLDVNSRWFIGLNSAIRIFQLRKLLIEDLIMVSFQSPRIISSFFIIYCLAVSSLSNGKIDFSEAISSVQKNNSAMMFPINDEVRNELEDSFRYYPDIENDDFHITEIEDISNDKQKRLKAVAYLKKAQKRSHVQGATQAIINILKHVENYGFSSHRVKHGKMEADIIYLVFYKTEVRRGEDRALSPSNSNFIAQIQYDKDMNFPIHNSFIDRHLKKNRKKTIEYNWNPKFGR